MVVRGQRGSKRLQRGHNGDVPKNQMEFKQKGKGHTGMGKEEIKIEMVKFFINE